MVTRTTDKKDKAINMTTITPECTMSVDLGLRDIGKKRSHEVAFGTIALPQIPMMNPGRIPAQTRLTVLDDLDVHKLYKAQKSETPK